MLPSEKSELWVRRILYVVLIAMALYLLIWVMRFVGGVAHRMMQQRQPPPEACLDRIGVGPAPRASTRS